MLIRIQNNNLSVLADAVTLENVSFDFIDKYVVADPFTAAEYIKEGLFEMRRFTIGTFFKIKDSSSKIAFLPERGIWIG